MNWTIIDYSEALFGRPGSGGAPRQRDGKFVVIEHDGHRYAVFSPRGLVEYHAEIAERFLNARGVSGRYDGRRDIYRPLGDAWRILGGGHWQLDEDASWLRLFGESRAYGPVALEDVAAAVRQSPQFGWLQDVAIG